MNFGAKTAEMPLLKCARAAATNSANLNWGMLIKKNKRRLM